MRVLVAYATKNGSTEEIADAIADELSAHGLDVACMSAPDADSSGFDAVVLGSAVYAGRWLRPARRFLKAETDHLSRIPFWVFSSGPFGEQALHPSAADLKWQEPAKVMARAEALGVREHVDVLRGVNAIDQVGGYALLEAVAANHQRHMPGIARHVQRRLSG